MATKKASTKKPAKKIPAAKKPVAKKVAPKKAPKVAAKKVAPKKVAPKKVPEAARPTVGSSGRAKKAVAKKTADSVKKAAKKPSVKAYKMHVIDDVLPSLIPHVVPSAGKISAAFKDLPSHLQPLKVSSGRAFLVEDEQLSQIDSLIEMQIDSYKWFLTEGLKELLSEISPISDFSGKKLLRLKL